MGVNEEIELKPNTIHLYVRRIQRAFSVYWGYDAQLFYGPIFNDPNTGLKTVLDNKCRQLQAKGMTAQGHNVLSHDEFVKLYNSEHLRPGHPQSLIVRIILNI